jgi:5-methylthioadenosine/S-adenosylhomocysteine deaminase
MSERPCDAGVPTSPTFVLRGGRILSVDPRVVDLSVGDILVDDGRIAAIGPALDDSAVETIDVSGHVLMPGFVDSHRHLWESALRGTAADMSLSGYFGRYLGQVGPVFSAEELYASTLLGAVEALDAGVTSLFDWCNATNSPTHADAAVEALTASGIRAVFGHGNPGDAMDVRRMRDRLGDDGLVTFALALLGPEFSSVEAATPEIKLARELDVIASMHVGCGVKGSRAAAVSGLAAANLLGPDVNLVHCNTISDAEVGLIVEAGSTVSITPLVECLMGHGTPAYGRFLKVIMAVWPPAGF